ncbi:MAG TPA: ribosome-associated translation inhibitor RaiA [Candidatus Acidoferrum sp.]|jgi:putative sigma-54 modulation protein|nr:ribosome-associated translation inhibitor RaiA [Candidatus Acidoferrum sp.]
MEILIQAKKNAADPRIKAYAQAKLEKLTRHFDHILEARMELSTERNKSLEDVKVAELTVHVTGRTGNILKAVQSAAHMNEAIDLVVDKLDRQIRQHKEKLKDHRRSRPAAAIGETSAEAPNSAVRSNGVAKIKRFKLKPISDEQARDQMDELGHAFFLFLNEDTQELNLLYRRNDGTLGLVEADLS